MKKIIISAAVIFLAFFVFPHEEAKAFEPVTMGLLAPVAMDMASKATPVILKGLKNLGKGFMLCGKDIIDIFRLPLGIGQTLFLWPFGYMSTGLKNIIVGAIAPFKLTLHILLLPVMAAGGNVNI